MNVLVKHAPIEISETIGDRKTVLGENEIIMSLP